ncbi:MAG: DUF697 domain-containing protein [Desulfamplus sp.]|nr:DUF697 domain-containing protein [Desulfamplus sp.]MBF0257855.1 DUF697 domain-containing protein [Desulfamplus sp.]
MGKNEKTDDLIDEIINKHIYASSAVGLIPLPFVDFMGVSGIQFNLLRCLADEYNIPFNKDIVKHLIASLVGGALPVSISPRLGASLAKMIPGPGMAFGAISMSGISAASTYAIGKVFKRHFEEGGTFLTFDTQKAKDFYMQMFNEANSI